MKTCCKDCAKRYLGCHASCDDYKAFKAERERALKNRDAINDTICYEAIHRAIKRNSKKK